MTLPKCPVCGAQIEYPDVPKRRTVRWKKRNSARDVVHVVIDLVPCSNCPAQVSFREDNGHIVCFRPNQPLFVRRA